MRRTKGAASSHTDPILVAMTGASGAAYGIRLLQSLKESGTPTHLIMSKWAERTILAETDRRPDEVKQMADDCYDDADLDAPPSSGAFRAAGMIVAPCSMKTLAGIAHGVSESLIQRAADVALTEHRRLVLLVRESPLSVIHIENMLLVARAGAIIAPPVPAFYSHPTSIQDIVDHSVGRVLDIFEIEHRLVQRWGEPGSRPASARRGNSL